MTTEGQSRDPLRRQQVLEVLYDAGECSTAEVAERVGISRSNCRNILRRLRESRCIETDFGRVIPRRGSEESTHTLTDRGRERLAALRRR